MATGGDYVSIRKKLLEHVAPVFEGIEIEVTHSQRFDRMCLTFRHASFAGWLPEQRFRRVVQLIPPDYYEEHLRGAVWFELTPEETEDDLMKAPRCEDIADEEQAIAKHLIRLNFFNKLAESLGDDFVKDCSGDFSIARKQLAALGVTGEQQDHTCLVFIRNDAYCDCEVLLAAKPKLLESYG